MTAIYSLLVCTGSPNTMIELDGRIADLGSASSPKKIITAEDDSRKWQGGNHLRQRRRSPEGTNSEALEKRPNSIEIINVTTIAGNLASVPRTHRWYTPNSRSLQASQAILGPN